jgi:hypothetical protein
MTKTNLFFGAHLLLTIFTGVWGFAVLDQGLWVVLFILWGGISLYTHQRSPGKASSIILICLVIYVSIGLFLGISGILAYLCIVTGLAAWDLDLLSGRFDEARHHNQKTNSNQLDKWINSHLKRVGIVEALATVTGGMGLTIHINLGFGLAIILSILGTIGLSQLIGYLKRMSN